MFKAKDLGFSVFKAKAWKDTVSSRTSQELFRIGKFYLLTN